ncbi:MAG: NYN domain-containing protein [Coriobacteriaceae bacterium]|jgi:predicted RNA-binding protein with PIN domain|nr:NYN domain-containing protein [Coriobacteriaceae bacterium]
MTKKPRQMLIVDGYNVLRSGSRYKDIAGPDYTDDTFNTARETLINDVIDFAGGEWSATIVFDGAKNRYSEGQAQTTGGVRIIFSPAGSTADKVIERLARDARARAVKALVVTSDATIQDTVFGGGIDRMSANDFSWEMNALHAQGRYEAMPPTTPKNTLAQRIDPATRTKLETLRDRKK